VGKPPFYTPPLSQLVKSKIKINQAVIYEGKIMQKWEYSVIRTYGGVVMLTDGKEVGKIVNSQPVGQMLYEYLNQVGRSGWELVGMAEVRGGVELVLKRPKVEDQPPEQTN
jgi:hypothetical protein